MVSPSWLSGISVTTKVTDKDYTCSATQRNSAEVLHGNWDVFNNRK